MSETTTGAMASPKELTESDSSRRDATTSSSNLTDGSLDSSCSPPPKRPCPDDLRNATTIDKVDFKDMSKEEEIEDFIAMMCSEEPIIESPRPLQEVFVMLAELVLSFYKDTTDNDFVLSSIRSVAPFPPREGRSEGGTHLNFFAHLRGSEEEYLFYGEVQHYREVVYCYKFPYETDDGGDLILHPPSVECPDCERNFRAREMESDDDEYCC